MKYLPTETPTLDLNSWGWLIVLSICLGLAIALLVAIIKVYWEDPNDSDEESIAEQTQSEQQP